MDKVAEPLVEEKTIDANLAGKLDEIARLHPDQPALFEGSRRSGRNVNYRVLAKMVSRRAGVLKEHGVKKGDRVLVLEPVSIELFTSILAVFRLGATVLILDPSAGIEKLTHAVEVAKPRALIISAKGILAALALSALRRIKLKFSDGIAPPGWFSLNESSWHRYSHIEPVQGDTPALITLTSGTSGLPKLIIRTHDFLRKQLEAVSANCSLQEGSCELTALPVFILANLASRVTSVIPKPLMSKGARPNAVSVVNQIQGHYPDRILASPSFVEQLMDHCLTHDIKLKYVKTVLTGGGPVFPRLLEKIETVCPRAEIITVFGSTEAEPISKIAYSTLTRRDINAIANGAGLPVGIPVPQVKIRIAPLLSEAGELNDATRLAALRHVCEVANIPLEAVGEIIVSGEHVVKGYADGRGDSETKIEMDGEIWHKTGDVGYFDKMGRLWLTGRRAESPAFSPPDNIDTTLSQCLEAVALSDERISRAACLTVNSVTTLFLETDHKSIDLWAIKDRLNWGNLNTIKIVQKIPVDTRHNSKVLYNKLARAA
jgi:acyl-CoA synthetase (AMP-forming)/AMP-acid ligase II